MLGSWKEEGDEEGKKKPRTVGESLNTVNEALILTHSKLSGLHVELTGRHGARDNTKLHTF